MFLHLFNAGQGEGVASYQGELVEGYGCVSHSATCVLVQLGYEVDVKPKQILNRI